MFFDEINTNENIAGLLKEILVDRMVEGEAINKYVIPVAACNPYKMKHDRNEANTSGLRHRKLEREV